MNDGLKYYRAGTVVLGLCLIVNVAFGLTVGGWFNWVFGVGFPAVALCYQAYVHHQIKRMNARPAPR